MLHIYTYGMFVTIIICKEFKPRGLMILKVAVYPQIKYTDVRAEVEGENIALCWEG